MKESLLNLSESATNFLINFVVAIVILLVGFKVINVIEKNLKKEHKFSKLEGSVKSFLVSFIIISLKILLIVVDLTILGVPAATLVTLVGSCGVAIGLALQGGLSNIAGGLMLLIFKPFKVGDYILANGLEGTVKSITMFYTTIVTFDNKVIQLPNGNLSNSDITNYSANETRRIDLSINVSYKNNIDKVKKVLNDVVSNNSQILKNKNTIIRLKSHGDSSLVFDVKVWVKTKDYWNVYYDLMEDIKVSFDKHKIEIPYPQLDVHMSK